MPLRVRCSAGGAQNLRGHRSVMSCMSVNLLTTVITALAAAASTALGLALRGALPLS